MNIAINCRHLISGKLEGFGNYTYEITKRICEHQKEHKFWTKLLTTAADLVRDTIEQKELPRKVGDVLFHLGNLPAGMNDRAFIDFLKSQELINAHSINILAPLVVVVNILSRWDPTES